MQSSNYVVRIRSGITAAGYGRDELLKAIQHDDIVSSPESIRIAIEDYFEICDTILEQLEILYDISTENKTVKKVDIEENIFELKSAFQEGIDVGYKGLSKILEIIESPIRLSKEEDENSKKSRFSPSILKKNIQNKNNLTKDYFFIIKLLNGKEEELKNISIKKLKEAHKDSKKPMIEDNSSLGYAERFANKG